MEKINSIVEDAASKAERKKKRSAEEISQIDEEIRVLKERKQRIAKANQQYHLISRLKVSGGSAWRLLGPECKRKKENVLAVYLSGEIPLEMSEELFYQNAPESIQNDRDVLLARLAQEAFAEYYYSAGVAPFRIPEQFLADKEIVTAVVHRYPQVLMQGVLPEELLDDEDVFRAYFTSNRMSSFLSDENPVSTFSEGIRGNAELMLQAANASQRLASDCDYAIKLVDRAVEVPDNALQRFSFRVPDNKTVVLAFVQRNGLCLKHASASVRGSEEIVRAACKDSAMALQFCAPGPTKRRLGRDRAFMLDIFGRLRRGNGNPMLYRMLTLSLKLDIDLVIAAYQSQSMVVADLPRALSDSPDFWKTVMSRDSSFWRELPDQFKGDPAYARAIQSFENVKLVLKVFRRFPFLSTDRGVWLAIIDSPYEIATLPFLLRHHAPEEIRLDKELMILACKKDDEVLECLNKLFQEDRDLVEAAVEGSGDGLLSISVTAQRLYPDLVAKAISHLSRNGDENDINEYVDNVAVDHWTNLDVAKAWFRAGGYWHDDFPESTRNDKEFGLLIAEHCEQGDFERGVSAALRIDKEFMIQALEKNSMTFWLADGGLQQDLDVATVAFGGSRGHELFLSFVGMIEGMDDLLFMHAVFEKAEYMLEAHDGFVKGLLCGMSVHAGCKCHLPILEQGAETSLAIKKQIGEYLGLPTGDKLRLLRRVKENMHPLPTFEDLYYESDSPSI
jgi:hypothetical protein